MQLFVQWHKARLSLEKEWMAKFKSYKPNVLMTVNATSSKTRLEALRKLEVLKQLQGHCKGYKSYLPLKLPF